MQLKYPHFICLLLLIVASLYGKDDENFIAKRQQLKPYYGYKNIVLIASPGRSGSTLLTDTIEKYANNKYKVLKTHLLPPDSRYQGKILFIFSNPDKAAESALHLIFTSKSHGATHFSHLESADQEWFNSIGRRGDKQTETHNLLAYDALGCTKQLEKWLHGTRVQPCVQQEAQILAIKYEHLWEAGTVQAIKEFLELSSFKLPPQRPRGRNDDELLPQEVTFKAIYNVGTDEDPLYHAYDKARELWNQAPPFQFLKLTP